MFPKWGILLRGIILPCGQPWHIVFQLPLTAARDGTEGLIWGPLHCNQMSLLWGEEEEEEEEEYYVQLYIPLQHCWVFGVFFFVLFLSGQTLMLYPLTFGDLSALFHKHRVGNILGIRNLNLPLFYPPPAILHTAHSRRASLRLPRHWVSSPMPHLNILPSGPFMWCVMCNLWPQRCQHGTMPTSPSLVGCWRISLFSFCRYKEPTSLKYTFCQGFNLDLGFVIERMWYLYQAELPLSLSSLCCEQPAFNCLCS